MRWQGAGAPVARDEGGRGWWEGGRLTSGVQRCGRLSRTRNRRAIWRRCWRPARSGRPVPTTAPPIVRPDEPGRRGGWLRKRSHARSCSINTRIGTGHSATIAHGWPAASRRPTGGPRTPARRRSHAPVRLATARSAPHRCSFFLDAPCRATRSAPGSPIRPPIRPSTGIRRPSPWVGTVSLARSAPFPEAAHGVIDRPTGAHAAHHGAARSASRAACRPAVGPRTCVLRRVGRRIAYAVGTPGLLPPTPCQFPAPRWADAEPSASPCGTQVENRGGEQESGGAGTPGWGGPKQRWMGPVRQMGPTAGGASANSPCRKAPSRRGSPATAGARRARLRGRRRSASGRSGRRRFPLGQAARARLPVDAHTPNPPGGWPMARCARSGITGGAWLGGRGGAVCGALAPVVAAPPPRSAKPPTSPPPPAPGSTFLCPPLGAELRPQPPAARPTPPRPAVRDPRQATPTPRRSAHPTEARAQNAKRAVGWYEARTERIRI